MFPRPRVYEYSRLSSSRPRMASTFGVVNAIRSYSVRRYFNIAAGTAIEPAISLITVARVILVAITLMIWDNATSRTSME